MMRFRRGRANKDLLFTIVLFNKIFNKHLSPNISQIYNLYVEKSFS